MSELRAPDPTLASHGRTQFVYITDEAGDAPATAHASHYRGLQCAGASALSLPSEHARWFAVPCRECFPHAPPPGARPCRDGHTDCLLATKRHPHLAWQVQP